jgi:hypothetical protein
MRTYPFSSVYRHKIFLRFFKGVQVLKPLNYIPFTKDSAVSLLAKEYGWKPYPRKHFESRFTRFYEGYWLPTRFGFDVRRVQYSSLILTGQMSRPEAVALLEQPSYDPATIGDDLRYVASKLEISENELCSYMQAPKRFYWDYNNQEKLFRAGERLMNLVGQGRRGGAY